jgi:hypothetical protein
VSAECSHPTAAIVSEVLPRTSFTANVGDPLVDGVATKVCLVGDLRLYRGVGIDREHPNAVLSWGVDVDGAGTVDAEDVRRAGEGAVVVRDTI